MNYISKHKNQLLDSLENQVIFADLASVIIGQKGLGKTFLLDELHKRLNSKVYISEVIATSTMTFEQLNKSIILQLGLSWENAALDLRTNIESNLNQRTLITIDNAHLLSIECLNYLLSLIEKNSADNQNNIYLIFSGEAQLASKLSTTDILRKNPNICVVFELQPIELNETKYLVAEFQDLDLNKIDILYDEQKLSYFWQLSHGNPKELSQQLTRWIDDKKSKELLNPKKKSSLYKQYWLFAFYSLIAFILILILIFQDQVNQLISPQASKNTEVNLEQTQTSLLVNLKDEKLASNTNNFDIAKSKNIEVEKAEELDNIVIQSSAEKEVGVQKNDVTSNRVDHIVPKKSLDQIKEVNTNEQKKNNSNDVDILLQLNDNLFTLQLMGLSNLESAKEFKLKHPLNDLLRIYKKKYNNDYLFIIILGEYTSKADANNAKLDYVTKKYPGNPWVKSIKAIKIEILDTNKIN